VEDDMIGEIRLAKVGADVGWELKKIFRCTHLSAKTYFICTTVYDRMPFMRLVNRSLLVNPEPGIEAHTTGHNEPIMREISAIQSNPEFVGPDCLLTKTPQSGRNDSG
jgi:hypothetical protein